MKINVLSTKMILSVACVCLLGLGNGCKKDKPQDTDPLTLLTAKKWKRVIKDGNPDTNPKTTFIYDAALSCVMDDSFEYTKGGEYNFQGGNEKCDPSEELVYKTNYTVDFSKNELSQFGYKLTILELTSTRMKLAEALPTPEGMKIYLFEH